MMYFLSISMNIILFDNFFSILTQKTGYTSIPYTELLLFCLRYILTYSRKSFVILGWYLQVYFNTNYKTNQKICDTVTSCLIILLNVIHDD